VKEISLHILDVVQNSIEAGATRVSIEVIVAPQKDLLSVVIADNGRGMSSDLASKVTDPFVTTRTSRRVGLGLPLFAATARQSGGDLKVTSSEGEGTRVLATFGLRNIDRPPLGDMATTLACLLVANPLLDLDYRHGSEGREFAFSATGLRRKFEGVSLSSPAAYSLIREHIEAGIRKAGQDGDCSPL
jgi:anti-sigma regulatory factor (Ser/Thr protein kinase)